MRVPSSLSDRSACFVRQKRDTDTDYCYTGTNSTADKVVEYDADGAGTVSDTLVRADETMMV